MNMKKWQDDILAGKIKKPLPILSYPGLTLIGRTVKEAVNNSDIQAETMKAVSDRCDTSACVTLMDLSVEAECFGADVTFFDNAVPAVNGSSIKDPEDIIKLSVPEVDSCRAGIFIETVKKAKDLINDRPCLCGAVGPFSLAGRLLGVTESMFMCFDGPDSMKLLLEKGTEFIINFIGKMKEAGADGVIIAEPVAGLLSPELEEEFSAPYIKRIANAFASDDFITVYHNCGQGVTKMTDSIYANGCDAYHFGNVSDLSIMLEKAPSDKLVMGNIDPVAYFKDGTPKDMKKAVSALNDSCSSYNNFVLSSGCDIPPSAKWENIDAFFK